MRRLDDIIINTLNTIIPTDSFNADAASSCKKLHSTLTDGNTKRKDAIRQCINISAERVKLLKMQRESESDNFKVSKTLRAEQTKVCNVMHKIWFYL